MQDTIRNVRERFNETEMAAAGRCGQIVNARIAKYGIASISNWEVIADIYHNVMVMAHKQRLDNLRLWAFAWEMCVRECIFRLRPRVDWDRLCP